MATSTNLGMYLPTRDDYISVKRDITDNLEIIDEAVGANTDGVTKLDSGLAYVAIKVGNNWQMPSGKTAQIGDYVIVNGVFGHATAVLTGGSTNIVENTNWVAETNGTLNGLNTKIDNRFAYYGINNSNDMNSKFTAAFTAINSSGKYEAYKSYPVMLLFAGSNFTGTFTGTFNVSDGGIRFAVSDETRMYQGLFNKSNNTLTSIYSPSDKIATHGTWTVVTETKTTGVSGNIALNAVANGKTFVMSPYVDGSDVFLRLWRASGNQGWYLTAVNPNTGATINNTQLTIKYIKIVLP